MLSRLLACAALVSISLVGPVNAQHSSTVEQQSVRPPGIEDPVYAKALLTTIENWLAANFELPAVHDHPRIYRVPAATVAGLRYKGLLPAQSVTPQQDVAGVYIDSERAIYLPEDWTGATPGELSVLVHEMVHHLQNLAGLRYECPQEREKLAYAAQNRWLGLFGRDLASDFKLDPFSLLVKMQCGY